MASGLTSVRRRFAADACSTPVLWSVVDMPLGVRTLAALAAPGKVLAQPYPLGTLRLQLSN